MNFIAGLLGVSPGSILNWVRKLAPKYVDKPEDLMPQRDGKVIIEVDEFWHYTKCISR